jgi:hypothetical protein
MVALAGQEHAVAASSSYNLPSCFRRETEPKHSAAHVYILYQTLGFGL